MLEFKRPQPVPEKPSPRWEVGVDRRRVAAFVAVALIGGFLLGLLSGRMLTRPDTRTHATPEPAAPTQPRGQEISGNQLPDFHVVSRAIRADTIEVEGVGIVRMIGVETPDGKQPRESYAVHGQNAVSFVEKTLVGQNVRLEFDPANYERGNRDELGQTLAYVYTRDGKMINSELVRLGLAFVRGSEQFRASNDFRQLERDAVQNSRGVWGPSTGSSALASTPAAPTEDKSKATDKSKHGSPMPPDAIGTNIPALTTTTPSSTAPAVFVSPADKMYHKPGCELLDNKKKRAIDLSEARTEGYTACPRCYASTVLKAP